LLAASIERAGSTDAQRVARAMDGAEISVLEGQRGWMRAEDHQFQQPLWVSLMDKAGAPGVHFDVEGSGYGFRSVRRFEADAVQQATSCRMPRPQAGSL
ncbi:MAG: branched-chain amino acid ABC transporter substrate-binding protein, partial [Burkholderiales bacterium]|nr:branched-chain amino acid ABC transporter substrate-binding protein [Burkholderiales bacterium]